MAIVNDDPMQIEALPEGKIKEMTLSFYKKFKELGYAPHINFPKSTKKSIHFYQAPNDKGVEGKKAPYSITVNMDEFVTFYFRKRALEAKLEPRKRSIYPLLKKLENDFPNGEIEINLYEDEIRYEITVKIRNSAEVELLMDNNYIPNNE